LEADRWTGFSSHFTHLKAGVPGNDQLLLHTAMLADGIDLGISKMVEACPGRTARKLDWLASCTSVMRGDCSTSSSDGQRFRTSGRGEQSGQVNATVNNYEMPLRYSLGVTPISCRNIRDM